MRTKLFVLGFACCLVALAACGDKPASAGVATLVLKPCRVAHVDNEVKCGTLDVIENRETQQGRTIPLNIVVLPAIARNKEPDPVFLFAGGPGQAATDLAREALAILGGLNGKRDLVLIDQRGTGKSNGLSCTFPDAISPEMGDPAKRDAANRKQIAECRSKLEQKADLTQYTTTIAMADIDQVRAALGYESINLWGGSYGTRAAMEYLRRYDIRVRSVVLDGVAPPSLALPESFARDAGAALEKMFIACGKEAQCGKRHAELKPGVDALLASLTKQPRTVSIVDPLTGVAREVVVTREMLLASIFSALYVPEMAAMLPASIAKAKQGDFAPLMAMGAIFSESTEDKNAMGMRFSVVCAEDVPRIRRSQTQLDPQRQPQPFGTLFVDEFAKGCEHWPKGTMARDFDQPVKSAKPVLILSGGLDPVTPPQYGDEVKKNFSNVLHAVAPNVGHGVSHRGCGPRLIKKFIESASLNELDAKCLESLPRPLFFEPLREKLKVVVAEKSAQKDEAGK